MTNITSYLHCIVCPMVFMCWCESTGVFLWQWLHSIPWQLPLKQSPSRTEKASSVIIILAEIWGFLLISDYFPLRSYCSTALLTIPSFVSNTMYALLPSVLVSQLFYTLYTIIGNGSITFPLEINNRYPLPEVLTHFTFCMILLILTWGLGVVPVALPCSFKSLK